MDATRFDALAKSLAIPAPRRAALRLLAGGLLGGLLARRELAPVRAACAPLGGGCGIDEDCCVGYCGQDGLCGCIADGEGCYPSGYGGCCNGQPCNADGFCGVCGMLGTRCNTDGECCQGSLCCFNGTTLTTVCTEVYSTGGFCPGEAPVAEDCPAGQIDCGGTCVDLSSHAGHCGACYTSCPLGGTCQGGVCAGTSGGTICLNGLTDCDGACVDLANDEFHCGACYASCPLGGYCSGGVCGGLVCLDGLVDCYGRCVDLYSDWSNCGACGTGCFEGSACMEGQCFDRDEFLPG